MPGGGRQYVGVLGQAVRCCGGGQLGARRFLGWADPDTGECIEGDITHLPRVHSATEDRTPGPGEPVDIGSDGGAIPGANLDGYLGVTEFRFVSGNWAEPGSAVAWGRPLCRLLPGVELTPWQRVLILSDSASGLSLAADPRKYPAINSDLLITLHRDPVGEWIGIDAITRSASGHGAAAYANLTDSAGPIGQCAQSLFASTAGS